MINQTRSKKMRVIIFLLLCYANAATQELTVQKDRYLYSDEQTLQIVVHIWGEVNRPGRYIVQDGTNVLELISLAGGPTEYSNLSKVKLTREIFSDTTEERSNIKIKSVHKEIIKIDLKKYLEKEVTDPIPVLYPGSVVKISKNNWFRYQSMIRIISQIAIVIQAMYFYSRIE